LTYLAIAHVGFAPYAYVVAAFPLLYKNEATPHHPYQHAWRIWFRMAAPRGRALQCRGSRSSMPCCGRARPTEPACLLKGAD